MKTDKNPSTSRQDFLVSDDKRGADAPHPQFASVAPKWGTNYLGFEGKRESSCLSLWL